MTADDVKPPKALLHRVSGMGEAAEIIYILRPVVYALAAQHWSKDKNSWRPWVLGAAVEYGARQLAKRDFAERVAGGTGATARGRLPARGGCAAGCGRGVESEWFEGAAEPQKQPASLSFAVRD